MSGLVAPKKLFSLASFEGLKLIRLYRDEQPELVITEIISLIEKVDPDGRSIDLEASAYLHTLVDSGCTLDNPDFYQICIKTVIMNHQPVWAKSMRQGRKRFVRGLDLNDQDVFIAAGLMLDPPPPEVVTWWDDVSGHARLHTDIQKMEQARNAERLTINHETQRLINHGIDREPEWVGLDDNFAGYDVLSYDLHGSRIMNKMIEVKSTNATPIKFIVTRNEWEQAIKIGEAYVFHIWDLTKFPPTLHVRTVDQITPHIPNDQQSGRWSTVEIPLGGS